MFISKDSIKKTKKIFLIPVLVLKIIICFYVRVIIIII